LTLKSLSVDVDPNALKDTCDYSCFLARSDEYQHFNVYANWQAHADAALLLDYGHQAGPSARI
jgi:hypothetical protein